MSRCIVACLARTGPLTFARVVGLCAQRRYAVESIIVIPSETPQLSMITLVIEADELRIANAVKQLDKLIDVLHVDLLPPDSPAACDLLLARIGAAVEAVHRGGLHCMPDHGMTDPGAVPGMADRWLPQSR